MGSCRYKKNKNKIYIFVCIIILIVTIVTYYINNDRLSIEELQLNEYIDQDYKFAIMIEQSDGTYKESQSNKWPTDMAYNADLSGCIDKQGNTIKGGLTFQNGIAKVKTIDTSYCYLYFDNIGISNLCHEGERLGVCLINNKDKILALSDATEGELYRYQGTNDVVSNYVCFGTSDKDTCINDTDKYMYRIIGINESGQIKLIKKEALNNTMQWYIDYETNITWPNSIMHKNIIGSSYLTNSSYMPDSWADKIAIEFWPYGDNYNGIGDWINATSAERAYNIESGYYYGTAEKIGLLYVHDYYYAYQSGGLNCYGSTNSSVCKSSWLHLSNNDSKAPSGDEYTISKSITTSNQFIALHVSSNGSVGWKSLNAYSSVRPVFYLTSEVEYVSGSGTKDDPYIIN